MKAVVLRETGGPEQLEPTEVPASEPGDGEVLWVRAAGINFAAVKPPVGATFPLEEASEAHRLIEERRSVGKVVLVP